MRQIVLYLEDEASMCQNVVQWLTEDGYDVKGLKRIDQAKEFFAKYKDEIVCVITDLNMSDDYLDDYKEEAEGGIISGWVWLQHFVYNEKPDMPMIVYSGFLDYLVRWLRKHKEMQLIKRPKIKLVAKGAGYGKGYKGLLRALEELEIPKRKTANV